MRVMAESTAKIVELASRGPISARIWEAETESGVKCFLWVTRVQVRADQDCSQFERELAEQRAPSVELQAIPFRLIL